MKIVRLPVHDVGQQIVVFQPVINVHFFVIDRQRAGLDAPLLHCKKKWNVDNLAEQTWKWKKKKTLLIFHLIHARHVHPKKRPSEKMSVRKEGKTNLGNGNRTRKGEKNGAEKHAIEKERKNGQTGAWNDDLPTRLKTKESRVLFACQLTRSSPCCCSCYRLEEWRRVLRCRQTRKDGLDSRVCDT